MITKAIAMAATLGTIFYHASHTNADGTPTRCRVTGKCKTWKTRPDMFELPVKHGMFQAFYINERNCNDWFEHEVEPVIHE